MAALEASKPAKKSIFAGFGTTKKKAVDDNVLPADYDHEKYGEINIRFIKGTKTLGEAARRWILTSDWREANDVANLRLSKQPCFEFVKANYPHYIHKQARNGMYCYYERPGLASFPNLITNEQGFTPADIVRHYNFITEYIWEVLDPQEEAKMVSIWDVTGVKMSDLSGGPYASRTRKLMIKTMQTMQQHYPERSGKLFIVNAPSWFTNLWRMISPHVDEATKKKISILGKNYHAELFEYIDPANVPKEFGGEDETPFGESPEEVALREYVADLQANGKEPFTPSGVSAAQFTEEEEASEAAAEGDVDGVADDLAKLATEGEGGAAAEAPKPKPKPAAAAPPQQFFAGY
mmetsp:Transcript_21866/g.39172  ORF Transcript_21866/g.39172 Transcript_21866/m.39172 type:complete len:350 (-) Transcript_21866:301-1350(-)